MPKGGELHYHLAGGAYPEEMLQVAASGNYCLDENTFVISKDQAECKGVTVKELFNKPDLYAKVVRDWSMKDFIPGIESGHDHFFQGFIKYLPIVFDYRPELLAVIIKRAADQQELYLEVMSIPDNASSLSFGELLNSNDSYANKRKQLLSNQAFQNNIKQTVLESERILSKSREELGCTKNPTTNPCKLKTKLIYYVLREQPLNNVFAQALNAFEAVTQSKGSLVGVNLVQPEDGIISLRDYHQQMLIFQFLHQHYPTVPISLHAGELSPQSVVPQHLNFHIREAIKTGHAQRIGHGVDINYENQAEDTLNYMKKNRLPVEINLISNKKILNIYGKKHPLNYYLQHNVPVVLSSDDEGVLRTNLTQQYVEAVIEHQLTYAQIKQINRNALTYAFLPGKSIWSDSSTGTLVPECKELYSGTCKQYIANSEKASLQWDLEQKLIRFESQYSNE